MSAKAYNADWWDYLTPIKEPRLWEELRAIYDEERTLGEIPVWAAEIIVRMMELPMCGYYAFPDNVLQILDAISNQECPDVVMRCYTVDPDRKILMSYYVFCLDAWVKHASVTTVSAELNLRDSLGKDWTQIANSIYQVLGKKTYLKTIVVQRLIHRLRWWMKSLIWMDDKRERFMLDFYGGDIRGDEKPWGAYGNSPYGDPYFTELQLPHIKAMEERIVAEAPNGKALLVRIQSTWLCAPKVFRYLEKLLAEVGTIDQGHFEGYVPSFLQCDDTYPDFTVAREWYSHLKDAFRKWLDGDTNLLNTLQTPSPTQRWLMHILWHKLVFHGTYEQTFGRMVGSQPHGKSGTKQPKTILHL